MADDPGEPSGGEVPQDPMAEDGAEKCDATAAECECKPDDLDAPAEECGFGFMQELEEAMPVEPIPLIIDPGDGLVRPVDPGHFSPAPAFTHDKLICIEDERSYVELFEEELVERDWLKRPIDAAFATYMMSSVGHTDREFVWVLPGTHARLPAWPVGTGFAVAARSRYDENGAERERKSFDAEKEAPRKLWGELFVVEDDTWVVPVRPVRERCRYYKRQLLSNEDVAPGQKTYNKIGKVNCTMRRSVGGAFLSLSDEAVYACDYRDPPEPESVERYFDSRAREKLKTRPDLTRVPVMGLPGESVRVKDDTSTDPEKKP
jgi:hypothetical protein